MEPTHEQGPKRHATFGPDRSDIPAGAMAAGGIVVLVVGATRHSTVLRVAGLLATIAACTVYARRKFKVRKARIDVAESHIRSELDDLDPVARAQVLADLARSGLHSSA